MLKCCPAAQLDRYVLFLLTPLLLCHGAFDCPKGIHVIEENRRNSDIERKNGRAKEEQCHQHT